jgi:hypothetical protein
MSTPDKYEEILPCGGTLMITKGRWAIEYYFPGPDKRYKFTFVDLAGARIQQYIQAFEENWKEFEKLKSIIPKGGEFTKVGKMNMTIRVGGDLQGVCIDSYHMPVSNRKKLDEILEGYRYAMKKAPQVQALLTSL